jgi:AraC-like DNA-binding protein
VLTGGAMDFKEATDRLGISSPALARRLQKDLAISVSAQWIRQARLDPSKDGYRSPPSGWEKVVARLARERQTEIAEVVLLDR